MILSTFIRNHLRLPTHVSRITIKDMRNIRANDVFTIFSGNITGKEIDDVLAVYGRLKVSFMHPPIHGDDLTVWVGTPL